MSAGPRAMVAPAASADGLPGIEQLLVDGGDERLVLDPRSGLNRYLCGPVPDPELLSFGSSTASVISEAGFAAARRLHARLAVRLDEQTAADAYAGELARIRAELFALCGLDEESGVQAVFAASGTDLHAIAAQLYGATHQRPALAISIDAAETGSGVPDALCGRRLRAGDAASTELASFAVRHADGTPRSPQAVDAEVEAMADAAVAAGRRVLLIVTDVSKSGLIAPSPDCALALSRRHGEALNILVDACQFRLSPATLRAYLQHGCALALTGSKFMSGPAFSGVLLLPPAHAALLSGHDAQDSGFGLLPRWAAALEEMRALDAVDDEAIVRLLRAFDAAVGERLRQSPVFEPLPRLSLQRQPLAGNTGWDALPSIFPFLALHPDGRPLNREQSRQLYRCLQSDLSGMPETAPHAGDRSLAALRGQLGQPIACGERDGTPVAALRLCVGARNIVAAAVLGNAKVIDQALSLLDKAEWLIGRMHDRPRALA